MWLATFSSRSRGDYDREIPLAFERNLDLGANQRSLYLRLVRENADNLERAVMLNRMIILSLLLAMFLGTGGIKQAGAPSKAGSDNPFLIGVFRPDGVIVPFARYANRKWSNPWHHAQPDRQSDEPDTIADLSTPWYGSLVSPLGEWHLSLSPGGDQTVRTSKSLQVCSHCQHVWGLLSDYPNPKQSKENECVRNLGIALSQKKEARVMAPLTGASPDWKRLTTFLGPKFERAEKAGLSGLAGQYYSAQMPPFATRARIPLSMLNLYRTQLADRKLIFYFEASKEYPKPRAANDAGCNNISLLGGWILRDGKGNLTLLTSLFSATDCDMKEGGIGRPFAILDLDGKTFAIVEEDSYEGEEYTILEIRESGVRRILETYAGSC
jgi:hypothetical protein